MSHKKSYPGFIVCFLAALLIETGLGFVIIRFGSPNAARLAQSPKASPPVSMRFVEIPPDVQESVVSADTRNVSSRSAKAQYYPQPQGGQYGSRKTPGGNPGRPQSPPAPEQQQPARAETLQQQNSRLTESPVNTERLGESLQNLDKYIASPGSGGSGNAPGSGSPGGNPESNLGAGAYFDTKGYDLGPWGNQIVSIVKSNWLSPVALKMGMKGIVGVSFDIERGGRIVNMQLISPSGVPSFDTAALNALKSSNPLPPLPATYPLPKLHGIFRFYYNIPIPGQ